MRVSLQDQACDRIRELFASCEDYTRPADIIADIMHFCARQGGTFDFDQELAIAETYVTEEAAFDSELG